MKEKVDNPFIANPPDEAYQYPESKDDEYRTEWPLAIELWMTEIVRSIKKGGEEDGRQN